MEIRKVDPFDDAAVTAWHAVASVAAAAGREDPPIWTLPEVLTMFQDTDPDRSLDREAFSAVLDGEVVGGAVMMLSRHDNPTLADFEVDVAVEHRRKGAGTALVEAVIARADELGRGSLLTAVNQPIGAPEVPGVALAAKFGFTRRNVELRRILDLPVPEKTLSTLDSEVKPHMDGYRIVSWQGSAPEEYAEQYARLKSLLMSEAPTGDMDYEPEVWDVARLRAEEALLVKQKRDMLTSVAVAPDGRLAGHTQIAVPGHDNDKTFQWDTLVLPEYRGHRLGMALKAANLRILTERHPGRRRNITWNAEQNDPMNAVNEKLGFRTVERLEEWQR